MSFHVEAVGEAGDSLVVSHWAEMWKEAGVPETEFLPGFDGVTKDFIHQARSHLQYQTFAAYDSENTPIASVSCQVWSGTMPNACVESQFKVGTMWAVYVSPEHRRMGVGSALVRAAIEYWKSIGCQSAVLLYASDAGRRVYQRQGFVRANMLLADLPAFKTAETSGSDAEVNSFVKATGSEADAVLVSHWRKLWMETGKNAKDLRDDLGREFTDFVARARDKLEFQSFLAHDAAGNVIGSACCQVWEGPLPLVLEERTFKIGSLWGVYVRPEARGKGVGAALVTACMQHLASIGCKRAITLASSDDARAWLEAKLGFAPSNAMTLRLDPTPLDAPPAEERVQLPAGVTAEEVEELQKSAAMAGQSKQHLAWLLRANSNQLRAMETEEETARAVEEAQKRLGLWTDPEDNCFTRNLRKLGRGFDLANLKARAALAAKFDKLSDKYEAWTLGNRSRVEDWLARTARSRLRAGALGAEAHVHDVGCGVGLMGHLLRLEGYTGLLSGVDVSAGMVEQARGRASYDVLGVEDVREGVAMPSGVAEVVVCLGALELLEVEASLAEFKRILSPKGGELWASFQLKLPPCPEEEEAREKKSAKEEDVETSDAGKNPTGHQHVEGLRREEVEAALRRAGLEVLEAEACGAAFYTPSPLQDGSLLPVPYLFVRAARTATP